MSSNKAINYRALSTRLPTTGSPQPSYNKAGRSLRGQWQQSNTNEGQQGHQPQGAINKASNDKISSSRYNEAGGSSRGHIQQPSFNERQQGHHRYGDSKAPKLGTTSLTPQGRFHGHGARGGTEFNRTGLTEKGLKGVGETQRPSKSPGGFGEGCGTPWRWSTTQKSSVQGRPMLRFSQRHRVRGSAQNRQGSNFQENQGWGHNLVHCVNKYEKKVEK